MEATHLRATDSEGIVTLRRTSEFEAIMKGSSDLEPVGLETCAFSYIRQHPILVLCTRYVHLSELVCATESGNTGWKLPDGLTFDLIVTPY